MKLTLKSVWVISLAILPSLFAIKSVHALEFKSVGAAPAVLFDAPSTRGKKIFVAPRYMPLEVVMVYNEWTKVRDAAGDLSWIESKMLGVKRTVLVRAANTKIRNAAEDNAALVFIAEKGVLLDLTEPAITSGWVKVKHRDGQSGYVKAADVWGE